MRKGWYALGLSVGLAACGGGEVVLPGGPSATLSGAKSPPLSFSLDEEIAASVLKDPTLERYLRQIHSTVYSGSIVVKLESAEGVSVQNGRLVSNGNRGALSLNRALTEVGEDISLSGLFGNNLKRVRNRVAQVELISGKDLADLASYFKITVEDANQAERFLRTVWKGSGISFTRPSVVPIVAGIEDLPDLSGYQRYLQSFLSTGGLDAWRMWEIGIKGEGITLMDVEKEWNLCHLELEGMVHDALEGMCPEAFEGHLDSYENEYRRLLRIREPGLSEEEFARRVSDKILMKRKEYAHGTAVLGMLGGNHHDAEGIDREYGIKGMIPGATFQNKKVDGFTPWGPNHLESMLDGWDTDLKPGDVYLFEVGPPRGNLMRCDGQLGAGIEEACVPFEAKREFFDVIQLVMEEGLVVVEPAANSGIDLGHELVADEGDPDLNIEDSGALVVGASTGSSRQKENWSNCGNRVNLFAWGRGIVTASTPVVHDPNDPNAIDDYWRWYGNPPRGLNNDIRQPNQYVTNAFGGTSAAGAEIAGVAVLLQSYAQREMGGNKYLTPAKIRALLEGSGIGAVGDEDCPIGVQPRLFDEHNPENGAVARFDRFWEEVEEAYPEIRECDEEAMAARNCKEIRGEKRRALRELGVGLVCNWYDYERSDPNCPDVARCVWKEGVALEYRCDENDLRDCGFHDPLDNYAAYCKNPRCLPLALPQGEDLDNDDSASSYDCIAGSITPSGLRSGKILDFDGDGKADLVNWTEEKWQIDLSTIGEGGHNLGGWDIEINVPRIESRWVWPVSADYDRDNRADISVFDKEHGVWYIMVTDKDILEGRWPEHGWDTVIQLGYHDELHRDVWQTKYARPMPGDYNGDGFFVMGLARSDGVWSIVNSVNGHFRNCDGGGFREDCFDRHVEFLTPEQRSAAPGWAYLPVYDGGISYKVPDGVEGAGEWWGLSRNGRRSKYEGIDFGGNEQIPIWGGDALLKDAEGFWTTFAEDGSWRLEQPEPNGVFGGLECHPFIAHLDSDVYYDRVVQCPNAFKIVLSSTNELLEVPLMYNINHFSLPGVIYTGSVSYRTSQILIERQLITSNLPPIIPVDMVSTDICSLVFDNGNNLFECQ